MDADLIKAILSIVVIDLVLSGDNAVVIGMAASRLEGQARRRAILFGAAGAVALRVAFTAVVAVLLGVPFLQLFGGVLLVWIAFKLVRPHKEEHGEVKAASGLWEAVRTIVMADVVMSLDNILAVGGSAHGDLRLLIFGLALSIPLITVGSGASAGCSGMYQLVSSSAVHRCKPIPPISASPSFRMTASQPGCPIGCSTFLRNAPLTSSGVFVQPVHHGATAGSA